MTLALPDLGLQENALVRALARHGAAPAVVADGAVTSYADLAAQVGGVRARLGTARRLVLLEGERTLSWLVGYLAALAAECPVLLVAPGSAGSRTAEAYDPDVRITTDAAGVHVHELRAEPLQELHPDLALLLSTSGSTGSPKLVRLSRSNLLSNAQAIVDTLGIRSTDRAITTLPVHYCYGLSVVHSHLLAGAALVLTGLSVAEPGFWELFRSAGATSFAGVPYTFDLLDRSGFAELDLPQLRYVTQAGGRLAPAQVQRYAALGVERGWDLVVMYGQTEATARMAVLPPDVAAARPTAIGRPVPGGSFTVEAVDGGGPVADGEVGELVYRGPNVMLGYATCRADLALGATLDPLRTGDLGRRCPDGLYEVVGRRGRFTKLFGLRVDQSHVEEELAAAGIHACCEPTPDGRLGVVAEAVEPRAVAARVRALTGLPRHAVRVVPVDRLPRAASDKPDHAAVRVLLTAAGSAPVPEGDVRAVFAEVLGHAPRDEDTFVSLGGDSLSFVEMTVKLEQLLGAVPRDWHRATVAELAAPAPAPGRARARHALDVPVALRALAILLVVGSHSRVFDVLGGAHVLLVVAGYNLARFQLSAARRARCVAVARSVRRIVVPTAAWTAAVVVLTGQYGWQNVVLLNHALGPRSFGLSWNLWFLEVLVLLLVLLTAVLTLGPVDSWQRRHPLAFAAGLCGIGLLFRFGVLPAPDGPGERFMPLGVLWLFALGMAAAAARTVRARVVVAVVGAWALHDWFGDAQRELVVLGGLVVLLGVTRLPSTRALTWIARTLASASLYIYVTHWQVYPVWKHDLPALSLAASLAVGIAYWQLVVRLPGVVRSLRGVRVLQRPERRMFLSRTAPAMRRKTAARIR